MGSLIKMKKYLFIVLLVGVCFGQDIVDLKTKVFKRGLEKVEIPNPKGKVTFNDSKEQISVKTSTGMKFLKYKDVIKVSDKNKKVYWTYQEFLIKKQKKLFREQCAKNTSIKIAILDLSDDIYGLSDDLNNYYDSLCYDITDRMSVLEYVDKNNYSFKDLNDYQTKKIGSALGVDFVIKGYAYKYDIPFRYGSATQMNANRNELGWNYDNEIDWLKVIYGWGERIQENKQISMRENAIKEAGSYIAITVYSLNVKTGKTKFIMKNKTVMKIG